jgi:charged multivesicular body protein 1|tara:strand:- start:293 stop:859 length:567 start_codon:yes stop_codon:yes gene_type:complete
LARNSKKCEKNEKANKKKLKKAIEQGNMDGARIYAQNAIREKSQALNFLRMSGRVDAVSARVQSACDMNKVSKSMVGVVKGMDKALSAMDVNKITAVMDKFEKQFEDLDVRSAYMEGAISGATAASTPEEDVDSLIQMVADEHGLAVAGELDTGGKVPTGMPQPTTAAQDDVSTKENDLAARLAALHK